MNSYGFDVDRTELSEEFKEGLDFSSTFLQGLDRIRPDVEKDTEGNVKSIEDAEQALTDTLKYLAGEASKKMDSSTVALLVKSISDSRTILSSGNLMREDADGQKDDSNKEAEEQKTTIAGAKSNISTGKPAEAPRESQHDNENFPDISGLLSQLEKHIRWSKSGYSLDGGQIEYLSRLKEFVAGFNDVRELIKYCTDYTLDDRQEGIWASNMLFLLIVYFSNRPEQYVSIFLLNPLGFFESPLDNIRHYSFDALLSYYDKNKRNIPE